MYTQDKKLLSIHTPLGEDILLLTQFKGQEGLSEIFHFDLELFSEQQSISFKDIIGKNVTISLTLADGQLRFFNGLIAAFSQGYGTNDPDKELSFSHYSATMVPWFWLLTRTSNSRIFQNLSVPDIVEKIFSDKGFTDFKFDLNAQYEERNYTVQYRETDFNFVSRLLEDEGIYYFFEHEDGKHTLVMADHAGANASCPTQPSVEFKMSGGDYFGNQDQIDTLKMIKKIQANKYTLKDYNYETPDADLNVTFDTTQVLGPGEREKYDYPGGYANRNTGDTLAALRMEAEESRITTLSGTSDCRDFASGYRFILKKSSQEDWNDKDYLLTRVRHRADQTESYFSGATSPKRAADSPKKETVYTNQFDCIDHEIPFRPRRITPVPVVEGVQTAIVVGPSGEEIYTDEHGRVKVQFHWDREGELNENSSCWLRVSQSMAGNGWGALFLPRIGHEVVVEFIEGNPDRPIVTGQVYHGVNLPPYELPVEKTKSTFKSSSSPGGSGFNEIRFDDKAGEEQVFIHAEKNFDLRVKNDRFETIDQNRHLHILNDKFEYVENNRDETIDADHKEKIGKDRHLDVNGKEAKQIGESLSLTVNGDVVEVFEGKHSEQVAGDYYLKADNIVIEAMQNITLSVGGSYIAIEPGSIEINTCGEIKIEGTKISVSGSAMTEIKGGIVKIN